MFIVIDAKTRKLLGKISSYDEAYVAASTADIDNRIILSSDPAFQCREGDSTCYLIRRLRETIRGIKSFQYHSRRYWIYKLNAGKLQGEIVTLFVKVDTSALFRYVQQPLKFHQRKAVLSSINWKRYPHFRLSRYLDMLRKIDET